MLTKDELIALINILANSGVKVGEAQFYLKLLEKLQAMLKEGEA